MKVLIFDIDKLNKKISQLVDDQKDNEYNPDKFASFYKFGISNNNYLLKYNYINLLFLLWLYS